MTTLTLPQITSELTSAGIPLDVAQRAAVRIEPVQDRCAVMPSLRRTIKALPVTAQIELVQFIVEGADFADFDMDETGRLDVALAALLSQSREADYHEDRRLHGALVAR